MGTLTSNERGCEHNEDLVDYPCPDCYVYTDEQLALGEKLRSVGFTYSWGGRKEWGTTIREKQNQTIAEAKAAGREVEYAGGTRWI